MSSLARKLLKSLSIKQGVKYDSPLSAAEIPGFIAFHNLDINEVLDPLDSFQTFNQFFYRYAFPLPCAMARNSFLVQETEGFRSTCRRARRPVPPRVSRRLSFHGI
jgi:phosphatidylserine decarboxylase